VSFLPFLAGNNKDHAEASENELKEPAINFYNRKYKLHNRKTVQDEVLLLKITVMNNLALAM